MGMMECVSHQYKMQQNEERGLEGVPKIKEA